MRGLPVLVLFVYLFIEITHDNALRTQKQSCLEDLYRHVYRHVYRGP